MNTLSDIRIGVSFIHEKIPHNCTGGSLPPLKRSYKSLNGAIVSIANLNLDRS